MNRYHDNFNDRNSHNVEIASRNNSRVQIVGNSPALAMAAGFAILLVVAITVYLWFAYHLVVDILVFAVLGFLALKMINHTVRETSHTIARVTSDIKQRKIVYRGERIVLYEDDLDTIRAIRDREEQVSYRIDQGTGPSGLIDAGADISLKPIHQVFRRKSMPVEEEEDFEDELG